MSCSPRQMHPGKEKPICSADYRRSCRTQRKLGQLLGRKEPRARIAIPTDFCVHLPSLPLKMLSPARTVRHGSKDDRFSCGCRYWAIKPPRAQTLPKPDSSDSQISHHAVMINQETNESLLFICFASKSADFAFGNSSELCCLFPRGLKTSWTTAGSVRPPR